MPMTSLDALCKAASALLVTEPPRPDPPKPATSAFQRRLAEQRSALGSESKVATNRAAERASDRASSRRPADQRAARQASSTGRQGGERGARAGDAPERQNPAAVTTLAAGGFDGAWGGGGGKGDGQGDPAGGATPIPQPALDGELDCAMLLDLLPADGEGGIFELLLPDGERLGVVADMTPRLGSFLLTPSSERLRQRLNQRKMELEKGLAQRIGRHVRLTVL